MGVAQAYGKHKGGHVSHPVAPMGPVVKCPNCGCVIPLHPRGQASHPLPQRPPMQRPMPPQGGPPMGG